MRNWTLIGLALAMWALLVAATPLDHSGSIEVGVFGGYNVISEDSELGNAKNPGNVPESGLLLGGRGGLNLNNGLGAELEFKYVPTDYSNGGGAAPIMGFRGNGLVHFGVMGHRLRPFLLIGAGGEYLSRANDLKGDDATVTDVDFEWHLGVGAKYHVLDNLLLRLDARYVNIAGRNDLTSTNLEFMLGVSWWMEGKPADTDEDGLADRDDKCPEQAEDKDGFEDSDGCPEADNDQDGILDAADKCPLEAEDKDGFEDANGCPDPDNDGDGVSDTADKCPIQAEDKDGFKDEDGCPDPDNDGDSVLDGDDKCPNQAGVKEEAGCPVQDKDKDGIPDKLDKCPDQAETFNGIDDEDGCPDKKSLVVITETEVKILQKVNFETGKSTIKSDSFELLDTVALVLNKQPQISKIMTEGHTDDVGGDDANLALSQGRAEAVRNYLIEQGVAKDRLEAKGYGETAPLCLEVATLAKDKAAEKKNKAALAVCREQNRRVQFKILEINGKAVEATETVTIKEKKEVTE